MNFTKDQVLAFLKNQYQNGDIIVKLILINIGIYLANKVVWFLEFAPFLNHQPISSFVNSWLALSKNYMLVLFKPFTLITYQFLHADLLHLVFNSLILYFFGKLLKPYLGIKRILPLYLISGVLGGLLYVSLSNVHFLHISDKPMVGASASIMAMLGAATILLPHYKLKLFFILDIELRWICLGLASLNFLSIWVPESSGTAIIHLGGLAAGLLFELMYKKGIDVSKPFNSLADYVVALFNPKPKVSFVNPEFKNNQKSNFRPDQAKINALLDKISNNGYDSLSKEEKAYLFTASKN